MPNRIEIKSTVTDTRSEVVKKSLISDGYRIQEIQLIDVYTIEKDFRNDLQKISSILANPVTQQGYVNKAFLPQTFSWAIEIGFLPGVTDNVANTAREMIEDLTRTKFTESEGVYTSQVIFITGKILKEDISRIARSLYNPVIQRVVVKSFTQFKKDRGMGKIVPRVKLTGSKKVDMVDLHIPDEEFYLLGKSGIPNSDGTRRGPLALDLLYLKTISSYFDKKKRNPTDVELESLAQTWSEHCKHTIFADPIDEIKDGLFRRFIKRATEEIRKKKSNRSSFAKASEDKDFCVSVFTDNSGAIEFDKDYLITHKVETHNSPSALDPFGGAVTGIVGVNRDCIGFGLGAKPVVNTYGFCFAPPDENSIIYRDQKLTQPMLSPRRILDGVIAGVNSGGNCSGIPTPQGFLFFDKRYQGKPLVFVGTIGIIPKKIGGKKAYVKKAKVGDYVVMVGGRVGLDGIHGATFSSEVMDTGSPATAVQIGDPITQKKLSDAIIKEARDLGLFNSITDNGAGGLSCSVAEMAKESGGCIVNLSKVPVKYPGLSPWQIWISESQERMTLAVPKRKWKKFAVLMKRRSVEATVIGYFTNSKKCIVTFLGKTIMDVDMDFLHNGLPQRKLTTTFTQVKHSEPQLAVTKNLNNTLLRMISRPNVSSFEFISMQYDHEVQGTSVVKPLQGKGRVNGEATVVRPLLSSNKGLIISQGLYPTYSDIDTYHMAAAAIDTAVRNCVATGSDPNRIALLDNFCWCSSTETERLGQLKRAAQACYDIATIYNTSFISGKDSMFNDFKGFDSQRNSVKISVPPTLLISAIGVVDDVTRTVSIDAKFPGDLVYLLGETYEELGGSEYYAMMGYIGNQVPHVDSRKNRKLYKAFYQAIRLGLVASAISVTRAGLAVALAKMSLAGELGIDISIDNLPGEVNRDDFALFSESQGRIIVTVAPNNKKNFEKIISGIAFKLIGKVSDKKMISIDGENGETIVNISIENGLKTYKQTFKNY